MPWLAGCESPENKAERLRETQTLACFEASDPSNADQQAHDNDPKCKQTPEKRAHTVVTLRLEIQAKCDVATRDFNNFMGR